jgi:outer membrane lipoprotein
MKRLFSLIAILILLGGCSSQPVINLDKANRVVTPTQVRTQFDQFKGIDVAWGGMIINTRNLEKQTQIEVLAYPLDEDAEPRRDANPQDRFLLRYDGYLEPAQYKQGRWISVRGKLVALKAGRIGETDYQYPLVQAEQLHLWPESASGRDSTTHFHFGIGVTIGN